MLQRTDRGSDMGGVDTDVVLWALGGVVALITAVARFIWGLLRSREEELRQAQDDKIEKLDNRLNVLEIGFVSRAELQETVRALSRGTAELREHMDAQYTTTTERLDRIYMQLPKRVSD